MNRSINLQGLKIEFEIGDITTVKADAIVNAANKWLIRGSGVCGAIHKAAGIELEEYCKQLDGCETGEAKITPAFNLPHKHIIHTVGPRYGREGGEEAKLLIQAHLNSLILAQNHGVTSIAFPAISTGVYGYPVEDAAALTAQALEHFLNKHHTDQSSLKTVIFVYRSNGVLSTYHNALNERLSSHA